MNRLFYTVVGWMMVTVGLVCYVLLTINPFWFRRDALNWFRQTRVGWLFS